MVLFLKLFQSLDSSGLIFHKTHGWSQERRIYRLEEFRIRSITPGALHTRRGRLSRDWLQRNAERLGIDRVKTNTREVRRIRREHPTAVQFRREVRDAVLKLNLQLKKL